MRLIPNPFADFGSRMMGKMWNSYQFNASMNWTKSIASLIVLAIGVIYLSMKLKTLGGTFAIDFDYIWLGGKVWLNGHNPYGSAFVEDARTGDLLEGASGPEMFGFPFNWSIPAMALAELPRRAATFYWRAASIIMLVPSVILAFFAFRSLAPALNLRHALVALAFVFLMQATAHSLANGQAGWVVLFGLSLILYGVACEGNVFTMLGLTLVLFKPHIGFPILATLGALPRQWPAIVMAGILTIALAVPAFAIGGVTDTVTSFVENMHRFPLLPYNSAASMTGIRNLFWWLTEKDLNSSMLVGLASLTAFASTIMLRRIARQDAQIVIRSLLITLAIILTIVPLHTYDFVIVCPFVVLFLGHQHSARWLLLLALAIIFRSGNIEDLIKFLSNGMIYLDARILNTLASIPLLIGCVWMLSARNRQVLDSSR